MKRSDAKSPAADHICAHYDRSTTCVTQCSVINATEAGSSRSVGTMTVSTYNQPPYTHGLESTGSLTPCLMFPTMQSPIPAAR